MHPQYLSHVYCYLKQVMHVDRGISAIAHIVEFRTEGRIIRPQDLKQANLVDRT